jgi:two-component system, sensor histidine kinase YesM
MWPCLKSVNGPHCAGSWTKFPALGVPRRDIILGVTRYRTVRGSIFLWVSVLLVCVLLAFSIVVYDYASTVARERFADALTSLSKSVMANLDAQVAEMNRLSLTLIYSQVFRSRYSSHLALPRSPATVRERIAKLENTEALIEIGDTILGPNQSAPQVNVFDLRGEMIGAGYFSRLIERDARLDPWYSEVMRKNGDRVILPPHIDPLQEETSIVVKGKLYMSLLRSFQDPLLSTQGIVEVMQYCDALFAEPDMMSGSSASIFVLDAEGRLLYPYDGGRVDVSALRRVAAPAERGHVAAVALPGKRDPQIYATAVSKDTGWTLVLGEPSTGLSSSILQYATRIAILTLSAILCSLAASYFIARRVTVPIKALHSEIEALELHNLDKPAEGMPRSDLSEIDSLRLAFRDMRLNLNESIREAVSLRAHEKEAQLVALQSQLNPHFLHNMLQTIAVMADEGSLAPIQGLIVNLSKVLRYVSSTTLTTATLGMEVECAESYLAAMRARFGDSLEYLIDVPDAMREIVVPRLIVQPFIENCFKYATSTRPPWRIGLRAESSEGRWAIEILDNGPGFSEATLERVAERISARKRTGEGLAPMSISGMGILNSYERLRLALGERAFFNISNLPEGGARVVMGANG